MLYVSLDDNNSILLTNLLFSAVIVKKKKIIMPRNLWPEKLLYHELKLIV